ncbi:hypothetical protein GA0115250_11462 [Streptomyces sp. BvitLS-983]|nr:hypothetical protein GA0115250_11462 [Streptomyces sp. BvitLS-983]
MPAASRALRHRHFSASPPSIAASLDPVVEQPIASPPDGLCHRSASMCTQRASMAAVCGYSSLSIMFLSRHSSISACTSGSAQVVQNVARFCEELPSIASSERISSSTATGSASRSGTRRFGSVRRLSRVLYTSSMPASAPPFGSGASPGSGRPT